jgi:hypothetical protein
MKNSGNERVSQWRRSMVNVLGAATTLTVAVAAFDTADVLYLLWIAIALVGIGLMLEPRVPAQTRG